MQPVLSSVLLRGLGALAGDPEIASVVTDSREAGPGSLFVCIRGERVDGHDYALRALEAGAAGVVVQRPVPGVPPEKCVQVPDALDAMIRLGANYRALYSPLLAGVTGSVGKTTTKEFCYAVFSAFGKTLRTEGNQNNEIGMPNTLFRLDKSVEYAVVEMGMQGLGEIRKLTLAAKPAGAVITCIGRSHLEQLGTRENILRAKLEICEGLPQGAPLVVNGDDDYLPGAAVRPDLEKVLFAVENPDADVRALDIVSGAEGTRFTIADKAHGSLPAYIPAMGLHNVRNALSAYALATRLGLAPAAAAAALANYQTTGHRQHVVEHGGVTVIEDCYNANPDSMRAALLTLKEYPVRGRRVAVLGDMFELGTITRQAHAEVGALAARCGVDLLLTVGGAMRAGRDSAAALGVNAVHCGDKDEALARLTAYCRPGDAVLVKASHGMAFETILDGFYKAVPRD